MQRELSVSKLEEADLVIAPQRNGTSFYDFHEAKKMIDMGERAAEAALGHLERLVADGRPTQMSQTGPAYRAAGDLAQG